MYIYNVFFVGTPAARMKKVPSNEVKKRSRELTSVFESFSPYQGMEGKVERIWITEIATDGVHLVSAKVHTNSCQLSLIANHVHARCKADPEMIFSCTGWTYQGIYPGAGNCS